MTNIFTPTVTLISATPNAEQTIAYATRVSNPANQNDPEFIKLMKYLIKHGHFSPFEMAHMTVEVNTTRAIAPQILRHHSFRFQEFSQRYADANALLDESIPLFELRYQDPTNRQNSIEGVDNDTVSKYTERVEKLFAESLTLYNDMLADGIAKECARNVLPLATPTRMYITANLRDWGFYLKLRSGNGTQKEHKDIAALISNIYREQFPNIANAWEI